MIEMLKAAKAAKMQVSCLSTAQKNAALEAMANALVANEEKILEANALDLEKAKGTVSDVMLDRLMLNSARIAGMAKGILEVAQLPDPVGLLLDEHTRTDGLKIQKVSVSMGVIAIIYESRPNVTSDAAALALKSGNVCVLRGGKEAFRSANAIVEALKDGLKSVGITENAVNLVQDTSRTSATQLMTANGYIDLLIPRGGAGLIKATVQNATVPCIATGTGICHVYVDKSADQDMALNIIENAKTSRPSVCNAAECCLVHKDIAEEFIFKVCRPGIDSICIGTHLELVFCINSISCGGCNNNLDTHVFQGCSVCSNSGVKNQNTLGLGVFNGVAHGFGRKQRMQHGCNAADFVQSEHHDDFFNEVRREQGESITGLHAEFFFEIVSQCVNVSKDFASLVVLTLELQHIIIFLVMPGAGMEVLIIAQIVVSRQQISYGE